MGPGPCYPGSPVSRVVALLTGFNFHFPSLSNLCIQNELDSFRKEMERKYFHISNVLLRLNTHLQHI